MVDVSFLLALVNHFVADTTFQIDIDPLRDDLNYPLQRRWVPQYPRLVWRRNPKKSAFNYLFFNELYTSLRKYLEPLLQIPGRP